MEHQRQPKQLKQSFKPSLPLVALVWENFGPTHDDRARATAMRLAGQCRVMGVEIGGWSSTYGWESAVAVGWEKMTLFPDKTANQIRMITRYWRSLGACGRAKAVFLCHYEQPATWLLAVTLRLLGKQVYVMNDSKADDAVRQPWREWVKRVFYWPYQGALAGSLRSRDYMAALGVSTKRIKLGYDGISVARLRQEAGKAEIDFAARDWLIVARLVPAKNLAVALTAYALYRQLARRLNQPMRGLQICGNGPLAAVLWVQIEELGLADCVQLHGWVAGPLVAQMMHSALALVLPSIVEPFGQVVAEAVAVGLPVLVSEVCGACDELVREGVNGFMFAPQDVAELTERMVELGGDEALWQQLASGCADVRPLADANRFALGVEALVDG